MLMLLCVRAWDANALASARNARRAIGMRMLLRVRILGANALLRAIGIVMF